MLNGNSVRSNTDDVSIRWVKRRVEGIPVGGLAGFVNLEGGRRNVGNAVFGH